MNLESKQSGLHGLGEEREDARDGLATHRDIVVLQPVVGATVGDRVEVQAERLGLGVESRQQLGDPSGEQTLLVLPDRAVRVVGGERRFRQDVQASEGPDRLIEVKITDMTSPLLVDQLQGQQAQERRGRRDHPRPWVTRRLDDPIEAQLCQERPESEDSSDARVDRRGGLVSGARSDVGDGRRRRSGPRARTGARRPAELGGLKKGGGELDRIAARNS